MNKVIAVMSAKGGVGKSTICANLSKATAKIGKKTLLVELDSGARGLDIMLDVKDIVFDLDDIIFGRCALKDAIVECERYTNLSLLPAPATFKRYLNYNELKILCEVFLKKYENVILDVNAGYSIAQNVACVADEILVVVRPDPICIRDTSIFANYLRAGANADEKLYMIVNMISKEGYLNKMYKNVDQIMDDCGLRLKGVIPKSAQMAAAVKKGKDIGKNSITSAIFEAIANRVNDIKVPLILREL